MVTGIELEQAVALITGALAPLGTQTLPVPDALGYTLDADVTAPLDQPPFDRSPLDGYALRAADIASASWERPVRLRVVETVYAGGVPLLPLTAGAAARIMTGAMLPAGCDCVLRQEDTDQGDPVVSIYKPLRPCENYVNRGEDYRSGTVLLPAGTRLDAAAVGLLSSAGVCQVPVRHRPRGFVLSTGDEVVYPHVHPLPPGKIYGSNLNLLLARLSELGIPETGGEHAGDDPQAVAETMERLLGCCDALITTGGVSVGDKDIFHQALPLLGAETVFWRLNVKPGTPALYSTRRGKPILSLSGNPFAAAATFELLARPMLCALSGEERLLPQRRSARLDTAFSKASPCRRFLRGRWQDGRVSLPEGHSSGQLASLVGCNCLVDLPAGTGPLEPGRLVEVLLL